MSNGKITLLMCCVLLLVASVTSAGEKRGYNKKQGIRDQQKVISPEKPVDPFRVIFNSAQSSIRFTVDKTLVPYKENLCCKSSFVDVNGNFPKGLEWHPFPTLEGPGWAANAVGGAYEIYSFGKFIGDTILVNKATLLLDHVLNDGFIDRTTGIITGYRDVSNDSLYLNYKHNNEWFCAGSMAKVACQLLIFSELVDKKRREDMQDIAAKTASWIETNIKIAPNGWYPRRSTPTGEYFRQRPEGGDDPLFEKSADGIYVIQLLTEVTKLGLADYRDRITEKVNLFMALGGIFGSINHDTYDKHENVAYSVAFRVLRQVSQLLDSDTIRSFAYKKCLQGLEQFKLREDKNGVATAGLLFMEKSWDTAYLWENAEAALAYFEAYIDTRNKWYFEEGMTILQAIAKHHHGEHGFLTEGVDWNNHVGAIHHFDGAEYGDIKYTEPLLNNMHIVEPTLLALKLQNAVSKKN